jgi:hypothetical protein
MMLYEQNRCLMTSAEAANTVDIPGFSDNRSGTHFISKKRLFTWTQAESQGSATGAGQTPLAANAYLFSCRLLAQREVIETLLMPRAQALQKRFDITFVPEDYCPDSTYESIAFPLVDVREGKDVKAALSVL